MFRALRSPGKEATSMLTHSTTSAGRSSRMVSVSARVSRGADYPVALAQSST
ncbi:MAG: hypothetical protein MZV70_33355 [Desulfobacterales bacterium]|nr:hypothetical protein [Desulfobacterales bacterium]